MTDAPTEREGEGALSKLRRRKVVQWGSRIWPAPGASCKGSGFAADAFHWPDATKQVTMLLLLLLGLPIVLVVAWYHGDRGEQRVTRAELAILTLLFLLAGGFFWRYQHTNQSSSTIAATTAPAAIPTDHSIAVLPFVNMSGDKEQEYFSDGISEELLNLLAKIPQLQVAARTSSFSFKGKEIAVPGDRAHAPRRARARRLGAQIGQLGAHHGAADQRRTGTHLWSQTYDRKLDDIFAIQDEIAADVVKQLKVTLLGAAPKARTTDPQAYALYLQAVHLAAEHPEAFKQSDALYRKALEIDPRYAPAWAALAENFYHEAGQACCPTRKGMPRLARRPRRRSRSIPTTRRPTPGSAGRDVRRQRLRRRRGALQARAGARSGGPDVLRNSAALLRALGRLDEALALDEAIVRRDPVNVTALFNLGYYQRMPAGSTRRSRRSAPC